MRNMETQGPEQEPSRNLEFLRQFAEKLKYDLDQLQQLLKNRRTPEISEVPESPEIQETDSKIAEAIHTFYRFVNRLSLVGLVFLGADQQRVRHFEVETSIDENGNITYTHQDPETTHILNVLAGRELFSEEEALNYFRENLKAKAKFFDISLPSDFDTYTLTQITDFFVPAANAKGLKLSTEEFTGFFYHSQYLSRVELPKGTEQEIYTLVWQAEQECGNPNVRFQTKQAIHRDKFESFTRAYFRSSENTIFIPIESFLGIKEGNGYKQIIAELSHAKQLYDDPLKYERDQSESDIRISAEGGSDEKLRHIAYEKEYTIPGSLENTAHHVIEPKLQKKYELLTKIKGVDGNGNIYPDYIRQQSSPNPKKDEK